MRLTKGDSAVHTAARALEGRTSGCVCQCPRTPSNLVARRAVRRDGSRDAGAEDMLTLMEKSLTLTKCLFPPSIVC